MRSRSDSNQNDIVNDARSVGASVFVTSQVGGGLPDLIIGFRDKNYLIEVKEDEKSEFTAAQKKFWQDWNGQKAIVYNSHEMLTVIGAIHGTEKEEIYRRKPK